jgi:hypothetical protein
VKNRRYIIYIGFLLLVGALRAHAATPTVSVVSLEPGSTVTTGTTITFAVAVTGFVNPTYQLSDSFVDGSLGNLNLNSAGEFSWTPEMNDVGSHTVTITGSDNVGDTASTTITLDVVSASANTVASTPTVVTPVTTTVATTAAATPVDPFTEDLTVGSSGTQVTELQQVLTTQGDFTAPVTGYYGSVTKAAVIKFQTAHNIDQLGIVGPATLAALNALENTTTVTPTTTVTTTPTTTSTPTFAEIQSEIQSISSSLSQVESQLSQLVGQ